LCGLAAAYAGSTLLAQFLFQIAPRAPGIYVSAALMVTIVAAFAAFIPARSAAGIAPAAVLRAE
jgi:ABC-type lipoprotein release transport system permease subunit